MTQYHREVQQFQQDLDTLVGEAHMKWKWSGEPGMDLHEALRVACKSLGKVNSYLEIGVDGGGSLNTVLCEGVPSRIVLCDIWNPEYCGHGDREAPMS